MWHLILPPIIIIAGIGILLWFFSRKMDDPSFLSRVKVARGEVSAVSRSRSLSRKAFFLKLLEKSASKFKTNSLRIHNFFQFSLERLRAKRKAIDEMRREAKEIIQPAAVETPLKKEHRRFWMRKKDDAVTPVSVSTPLSIPPDEISGETDPVESVEPVTTPSAFGLFRRKSRIVNTGTETGDVGSISPEAPAPEPILKKEATRPEYQGTFAMEKDPREGRLIDRIAENPRDAASYEELGDLYLSVENMQDAKACYRQALKLHPTNRAVKLKIRKVERFFEKRVS